jgi:hypothetical protein
VWQDIELADSKIYGGILRVKKELPTQAVHEKLDAVSATKWFYESNALTYNLLLMSCTKISYGLVAE